MCVGSGASSTATGAAFAFIRLRTPPSIVNETVEILLAIARLPLLPYVALSVSAAYFGLASLLARRERIQANAFFKPPDDIL